MYCDAIHLKEVINNILRNAIEAIETNGEIEIRIIKTNKLISLAISDNGCGIAAQNLPYVAAPYFTTKKMLRTTGWDFPIAAM